MEIVCIKCQSEACVKNCFLHGYIDTNVRTVVISLQKRLLGAIRREISLFTFSLFSGLSMRMTGKIIGVSTQSVMGCIKLAYKKYAIE